MWNKDKKCVFTIVLSKKCFACADAQLLWRGFDHALDQEVR